MENDRESEDEGERTGWQDKPSGTESYVADVRGGGSIGSRSGVKGVEIDILIIRNTEIKVSCKE